jgi:hypothetical protein
MVDEQSFDVFLSHNSEDKLAVETLACRLEDETNLRPFLDKWYLIPGESWQEKLEQALKRSQTCAVFIGPSGLGPWHNEEMRGALRIRVRQTGFRVIPVLLPGATEPKPNDLPLFLSGLTWVDFQRGLDDSDAFHQLISGIQGIPPGRDNSTDSSPGEQPQQTHGGSNTSNEGENSQTNTQYRANKNRNCAILNNHQRSSHYSRKILFYSLLSILLIFIAFGIGSRLIIIQKSITINTPK